MKGLRLLTPGHGSIPVELDPGVKLIAKNGKATVFVDRTVWESAEWKDRAVAADKALTHVRNQRAKEIMLLGNKTADCLTLETLNDNLKERLRAAKGWCVFWFFVATGCFGVACWAVWTR